jgi:hypothetical protein
MCPLPFPRASGHQVALIRDYFFYSFAPAMGDSISKRMTLQGFGSSFRKVIKNRLEVFTNWHDATLTVQDDTSGLIPETA